MAGTTSPGSTTSRSKQQSMIISVIFCRLRKPYARHRMSTFWFAATWLEERMPHANGGTPVFIQVAAARAFDVGPEVRAVGEVEVGPKTVFAPRVGISQVLVENPFKSLKLGSVETDRYKIRGDFDKASKAFSNEERRGTARDCASKPRRGIAPHHPGEGLEGAFQSAETRKSRGAV